MLTNKTASLTEFRDLKKVIEKADGKPVAILNRNQLEGCFVPATAVGKVDFQEAVYDEVASAFKQRQSKLQTTLNYLKDK